MRYGIIKTQRTDDNRKPVHWLKRGTVVRILRDDYVETVCPVSGVPTAQWPYSVKQQIVRDGDVYEVPQWSGPLIETCARGYTRIREWARSA